MTYNTAQPPTQRRTPHSHLLAPCLRAFNHAAQFPARHAIWLVGKTVASLSMPAVHSFQHPRLAVRLALGHKYNAWYLIFSQPYRTADSREVSRLDAPGPGRPISWSPRPRFWFNQKATSGWERGGESLLDLLMSLDLRDPPLFAIVDVDHESGANKVEVLLSESRLAHYCEGCGRWEVAGDYALRWFMVREDTLPGYLCPPCHAKDWIGARTIRSWKRIRYKVCGRS